MKTNLVDEKRFKYSSLIHLFFYVDAMLIFFYLFFREEVLSILVKTFDQITLGFELQAYRFLVWGFVLFLTCAASSFFRQQYFLAPKTFKKGIVIFEFMVLGAVTLSVLQALTSPDLIDPNWILSMGIWSYSFEILITAGAGYLLADFLSRIRHQFNNV